MSGEGDQFKLADQPARDRILNDLDATLIVEAAAGTGKTTALIGRIVALIAAGRSTLDKIVAVTFTDKAAGELKLRLREEIERKRLDQTTSREAVGFLEAALPQLEQARIGTIHSFCGDLLHEHPVEAGIDPRFEVAANDAAARLLDRAFDRWFEAVLANPGEAVKRILCRRDFDQARGPRGILRSAAQQLCDWRDYSSPWRRQPFERRAQIDLLIKQFKTVAELAPEDRELVEDREWLGRSLGEVARFVNEATRLEEVRGRDYDVLENNLCSALRGWNSNHWKWKGGSRQFFAEVTRAEAMARRNLLRERLEQFRREAEADLAAGLRDELWPIVGLYGELKAQAGALDFMDLLVTARDLIRDNPGVRNDLQARFSHIFVDEFQDTDPLQAEIMLLLASRDPLERDWRKVAPTPGKLFIVGDPKQSIYRFRRADVSLYQRVKSHLCAFGAVLENLTVSFRAVPSLQQMVNAAFQTEMIESETQAAYAPLDAWRPDTPGQPTVVALPVPAPYSDRGRITDKQVEGSLADAIGAFAAWLINHSGWTVTERERRDERRSLRARHLCILFRRFNAFRRDVTRDYVRALEARGVPHVLVGGSSFHEREEVSSIRAALTAIERPDDELSVFATLRGPIFALSDSALLAFRDLIGTPHPFRPVPADAPPEIAEVARALEVLRDLHRGRNRRSIADTIALFMNRTRAHAGFAMWPTGEQALANVARLIDEARRYESRKEGVSFRGFVEHLERRAEEGMAGEAPVVEEGSDGVRLMTVHSAKGLEFPVVILADITCHETASEAARYVDPENNLCALRIAGCSPRDLLDHQDDEIRRDREEAVRLLYVAATRARDLIVAPVIGDERHDGWLRTLTPVLYPADRTARTPASKHPPGCPEFGDDSVAQGERPPEAPSKARSVAPGLHLPERGTHRVVWWDPSALALRVEESMGLRQDALLRADESGTVSRRGADLYNRWKNRREQAVTAARVPSIKLATVTELAQAGAARSDDNAAVEIQIEQTPRDPNRPRGVRFGALVHAIMQDAPFDSDLAALKRIAKFRGRILGATPVEIDAAAEAAARALSSAVIARAFAAGTNCRREASIVMRLEDGTVVEGVADLAFQEVENGSAVWTVVDFKTDADLESHLEAYRLQLGFYVRGIMETTGALARGVVLWT